MIRWMFAGIFRDKTRSIFPLIVITLGVTLMIALMGFMEGIFMGMMDSFAKLDTGHLRLVNRGFYEEEHLTPLDRALGAQREVGEWLQAQGLPVEWAPRIRWGAIMDVPDEQGNTRNQTPITGMALDLFSSTSKEIERLKLNESLVEGRLPREHNEMLVGYLLAQTLELKIGDRVTLMGQSFDGGLSTDNYVVAGLVRFGIYAMDKRMALIDLKDAQSTFYMEGLVTDWLGYFPNRVSIGKYDAIRDKLAKSLAVFARNPPKDWMADDDPFVLSLLDQRNTRELHHTYKLVRGIIVGIFSFIMMLVLWNAALLSGIHRYGEMGLRLALGETHRTLVASLLVEALIVGILGALLGAILGGGLVYYLQEVGVNMGDAFAQSGMLISDVMRGRLTPEAFMMGIFPGILASMLGTLISSIAVFKRSEANLFREMEMG